MLVLRLRRLSQSSCTRHGAAAAADGQRRRQTVSTFRLRRAALIDPPIVSGMFEITLKQPARAKGSSRLRRVAQGDRQGLKAERGCEGNMQASRLLLGTLVGRPVRNPTARRGQAFGVPRRFRAAPSATGMSSEAAKSSHKAAGGRAKNSSTNSTLGATQPSRDYGCTL